MKTNKTIYENPIIYLIIFLIGFGIIMMYSASSTVAFNKFNNYSFFLEKHISRLIIGVIALLIFSYFDFKYFKIYSKQILFVSFLLLISAYFLNDGSSTRRWLIIGGRNIFTTSDFAKFSLIIFTAHYIEKNKKHINNLNLIISGYIPYILATLLLIFFQPDLSTTFAITTIIITMLIIGGFKIKYLFFPIITSLVLIAIKLVNTPYQLKRFLNWKNGDLNRKVAKT